MLNWLKRLFARKRPTPPLADLLAAAMRKHQAELARSMAMHNALCRDGFFTRYSAPTQDTKGRWRDAKGRFARDPSAPLEWGWKAVSAGVTVGASSVDQTSNTAN